MEFLVIARPKHPIPADAVPSLLDGLTGWIKKYKSQKKMGQAWSIAGQASGAVVLNVGSLDELDGIVMEMPSAPFSEVEVIPLCDAEATLAQTKRAFGARAAAGSR